MKKKLGVTFWKKCILAKFSVFQWFSWRFLFRGPIHPSWGPFCHGRKKNWDWSKKVTKFFYALLRWLPLINHWVLSPYLGTSRTGLTRAFRNGKTIGKTPKNEVPRDKSLNNIFYMYKSVFKDSSKFGLRGDFKIKKVHILWHCLN